MLAVLGTDTLGWEPANQHPIHGYTVSADRMWHPSQRMLRVSRGHRSLARHPRPLAPAGPSSDSLAMGDRIICFRCRNVETIAPA